MVAAIEQDTKTFYQTRISTIREKRNALPLNSTVADTLCDEVLDECLRFIQRSAAPDLEYDVWMPPMVAIAHVLNQAGLVHLEEDISAVLAQSGKKKARKLRGDLQDRCPLRWRERFGDLFEVFVKSRLIARGLSPAFEVKLPNQRDIDACVRLGERSIYLECITISQSEFDRKNWHYLGDKKKADPKAAHSYGVIPAKTTRRVLAGLWEKLAKGRNPDKHQQALDHPNVLLLSFPDHIDLAPDNIEVEWAMKQLFSDEIRDFLREAGCDDAVQEALASAPKKISAVVGFDRFAIKTRWVNPTPSADHALADGELSRIESWFADLPLWCRQLMRLPDHEGER